MLVCVQHPTRPESLTDKVRYRERLDHLTFTYLTHTIPGQQTNAHCQFSKHSKLIDCIVNLGLLPLSFMLRRECVSRLQITTSERSVPKLLQSSARPFHLIRTPIDAAIQRTHWMLATHILEVESLACAPRDGYSAVCVHFQDSDPRNSVPIP